MDEDALNKSLLPSSPIDVRVGERVREYRVLAGFTVSETAGWLGTREQDYEDREAGKIRFAAADLIDLSRKFRVRPSYFLRAD